MVPNYNAEQQMENEYMSNDSHMKADFYLGRSIWKNDTVSWHIKTECTFMINNIFNIYKNLL